MATRGSKSKSFRVRPHVKMSNFRHMALLLVLMSFGEFFMQILVYWTNRRKCRDRRWCLGLTSNSVDWQLASGAGKLWKNKLPKSRRVQSLFFKLLELKADFSSLALLNLSASNKTLICIYIFWILQLNGGELTLLHECTEKR